MARRGGVLLTGATGLLGRYLLRDLLAAGFPVAVLARDGRSGPAEERVRAVTDFARESAGKRLPAPTVLPGDLRGSGLGLADVDRGWLARHCSAVVHAAASVSFRTSPDGEPRETNAEGTRRLLALCGELAITDFHHVSTAFVCGERAGPVLESDLDCGQEFHNDYERSKCEAERSVRACAAIRPTVYRPTVIVGDSRTGYTSTYHGLYRFLEIATRLAVPRPGSRTRHLPLRLPFAGPEPRNLVPVDWVSRAVVGIVRKPDLHGKTYHLTATRPTTAAALTTTAQAVLRIAGVELAGRGPLADPSDLERHFLEQLREYWPYLGGDPDFDCRNTRAALPELPPPPVDGPLLARLIRFAVADGWGRKGREETKGRDGVDCADYVERFFPRAAGRSVLARVPIDVTLALEVRGPGGGRWFCRWRHGRPVEVTRAAHERPDVTYRTDVGTFEAIVSGRESPQAAFFARRIEIAGSVEKGLKLAVLFGQFVRECPYRRQATEGVLHEAHAG